ncbi:MAG: hypothetical protein V9H69_18140 [Anaerolineae bacterium]
MQRALILEHGMPAVWLNWRHTMREIKGTFNGNGREAEVWQQTHAPVLILDDPDKGTTEWSVGYLYDLLDQRMALTGGRQGPVLLVLNQLPAEFAQQLAQHGHLGVATAQRGLAARPAGAGGLQRAAGVGGAAGVLAESAELGSGTNEEPQQPTIRLSGKSSIRSDPTPATV